MESIDVKELLLAPRLERGRVAELLKPFGFQDPAGADRNLQRMAEDLVERRLLADTLPELLLAVSQSADPDRALNYMERFAAAALNRTRLYSYLKESPQALEILAKTLGASSYMAEILIRDPFHFYWVTDPATLRYSARGHLIEGEIAQTFAAFSREPADEERRWNYLRFLKRRETLRIGVRDLLRLCPVEETLAGLSLLAETLISAAYRMCDDALRAERQAPAGMYTRFCVIGMGKLGGGELNFSSDVDLIYVYDEPGEDWQPAAEFYRQLCQRITAALDAFTNQGYVYRVDLRLRPEGESGAIATRLDDVDRYYRSRGENWERLALLKARPIAGDRSVGRAFLRMTRGFVYDEEFGGRAREDIRNMKRRIDRELVQQRADRGANVKLGSGGIREIELIAQSLQVRHGPAIDGIRQRNTLAALRALEARGLISAKDCQSLVDAYRFLRDLENKLQMVDDAQTHALPRAAEEVQTCARRLGYSDQAAESAASQLLRDFRRHTNAVNRIFEAALL
ncbi:MAG TPA: putative nucleotidyltransferase substrate binding domain-containing protein [Terriglobia bacterium]|nr:putative nucleotidyltransferase substrate binding domain-containing protein [Terriglobia bacterium]